MRIAATGLDKVIQRLRMAEVTDRAPLDEVAPPTEEEIRALANLLGISFDAARVLAGHAALSEIRLPNGDIIDG